MQNSIQHCVTWNPTENQSRVGETRRQKEINRQKLLQSKSKRTLLKITSSSLNCTAIIPKRTGASLCRTVMIWAARPKTKDVIFGVFLVCVCVCVFHLGLLATRFMVFLEVFFFSSKEFSAEIMTLQHVFPQSKNNLLLFECQSHIHI